MGVTNPTKLEVIKLALGTAELDLHYITLAMRNRLATPRRHTRCADFLQQKMIKAMGVIFISGTGELNPLDLDRHNRNWFNELCIEAGTIFGEHTSAEHFLAAFTKFLDDIYEMRQSVKGRAQA